MAKINFLGNYGEMTSYGYDMAYDFYNMYKNEIENEERLENMIGEYLDSSIIYFEDQGKLMEAYQTPEDANLGEAFELCYIEIRSAIEIEEEEEEEDEEEKA